MKDYNLEIIDAAFVAAGWAQHGKALLYRFHPDKDRNDQSFGEYGLQGRNTPRSHRPQEQAAVPYLLRKINGPNQRTIGSEDIHLPTLW